MAPLTARLALAAAAALWLAACGGSTPGGGTAPDGGGSPDGGSPDGGSPDGGSPDGGSPDGGSADGGTLYRGWLSSDPVNDGGPACAPPTGVCPAAGPAATDSCVSAGAECRYMHPEKVDCQVTATCLGSGWSFGTPSAGCGPPPADCPASIAAANGVSCPTIGKQCNVEGVVCTCKQCNVTNCGPSWSCVPQPSTSPGCPRVPPKLSPCCPEGLSCYYGPCQGPTLVKCVSGSWQRQIVGHCN